MKNIKTNQLKKKLASAGLSQEAIRAAWPTWWNDDAAQSASAFNDLKFSLSRKLGIAPTSLFDEGDAVFVWHGESKFKGVSAQSDTEKHALIAYAHAISRLILSCSEFPPTWQFNEVDPGDLRSSILAHANTVALPQLLKLAYMMGVPVVYLRVFPLGSKKMTAMAVRVDGRYAILIARDTQYAPWLSFYVAHELAHIFSGHLESVDALVDAEIGVDETDTEEIEADRFALTLLTGQSTPRIEMNRAPRNPAELASAVLTTGEERRIDPGTLALCYGFVLKDWTIANAALKRLCKRDSNLWHELNAALSQHLDFSRLTDDNRAFALQVLGLTNRGQDSSR